MHIRKRLPCRVQEPGDSSCSEPEDEVFCHHWTLACLSTFMFLLGLSGRQPSADLPLPRNGSMLPAIPHELRMRLMLQQMPHGICNLGSSNCIRQLCHLQSVLSAAWCPSARASLQLAGRLEYRECLRTLLCAFIDSWRFRNTFFGTSARLHGARLQCT